MAGYTKTYTLDFTASGDTVYTGADKLDDNIDSIITWINNIKKFYAGATAPTSPAPDEGQPWWDSTNNAFYIYDGSAWFGPISDSFKVKVDSSDGTEGYLNAKVQNSIVADETNHKIHLSGDSASPGNSYYYGTDAAGTKGWNAFTVVPVGAIFPWAGDEASPPTGFLLCDGSAVSRTTYSALYTALGTTYGSGNGSTTFNIPDTRAKVIVGVNNATLPNGANGSFTTRNRAATGGTETHTLTGTEMPAHTHTTLASSGVYGTSDGTKLLGQAGSTGSAGTGGAHNNMQPYVVANCIIKY